MTVRSTRGLGVVRGPVRGAGFAAVMGFGFGVCGLLGVSQAMGQVLPVTPYTSSASSPFASLTFDTFQLEDFEDGLLNTPGLSINSNFAGDSLGVSAPGFFTDSVDGDNGPIDGLGRSGRSYASLINASNGAAGFTLTFAPDGQGRLPTHVGLVWTDGTGGIEWFARFFDAQGGLLGTASAVIGDGGVFSGETGEDRFFGAAFLQGIARVTIFAPQSTNSLEIDHVQFGVIPTPGAVGLLGLAGLAAASRRTRRRG
jgi:hypothetical protein